MKTIFAILLLVLMCCVMVFGQAKDVSREYFTDTVVVDQDGRQRKFYTNLMEGKVVIINAFHTDCASTVPVMAATLRRLQKDLGTRAKEFNIISMSVDPADDAAKTKAFATKVGAEAGWYFVTGDKANMEFMLKKLGLFVADKESHSTVLLVGNTKTGLWKKVFGLAAYPDIQKQFESVLDDKTAPPPTVKPKTQ